MRSRHWAALFARNFSLSVLRRFLAGTAVGGFGFRSDISRENRTGLGIFFKHGGVEIHGGTGVGRAAWHGHEAAGSCARPSAKSRAAICGAVNGEHPCRAINNKENI
jgi:hypothetical protein